MSCPGEYIVHDGTKLRILLTCPHGGVDSLTSGEPRENNVNVHCSGVGGETFEDKPDLCTKKLTRSIANNILNLCGKHPYIQIAEISRKYVDFNRDVPCAYDDSNIQAKNAYEDYHNKILMDIQQILPQGENGIAFLFDIHGTGRNTVSDSHGNNQYVEVIIGTEKGDTIFPLNQKDTAAWWGTTTGLIPLLLDKGIAVWPPNQTEEEEKNAPLDGGYTIETYSSKFSDRLVTIQVEVVRCLREPIYAREKFSADLAECIYRFVKPFI